MHKRPTFTPPNYEHRNTENAIQLKHPQDPHFLNLFI